jgi:hypothetical protein
MPAILLVMLLLPRQVMAQRVPAFDPERIFAFGDTGLDGKLSLEEYREHLRASPRMKNAAATIEPLFRRLDKDRDGFLSVAEYRAAFPGRPGGPGTNAGTQKQKPPMTDVPIADKSPIGLITPDQERCFEAKIRPVLATRCGKCHSSTAEKLRGGLRLDSREVLRQGGDSGPAIVPGNPDESLLIQAIRYRDDELRMLPKGKLQGTVIADFEAWVKMGAPDPWPAFCQALFAGAEFRYLK